MKKEPSSRKKPIRKIQIPRKVTLSRRLKLGNPTGKDLEIALKTLRTGVYPTESSKEG